MMRIGSHTRPCGKVPLMWSGQAIGLWAALAVASLPLPSSALTIAIDPGHGGSKEGALSPSGVKEKDVSLAVAKRLRKLLEADKDLHVVMTRDGDDHVELRDRTAVANKAKADLLISIHCNSMPTTSSRKTTSGIETYFLSADASDAEANALAARENADVSDPVAADPTDPVNMILQDLSRMVAHADAKRLAEEVHLSLVKSLGSKSRGVRQAPFIVLLGADMPAILVEIGFISHPVEGKRLADPAYQQRIAVALGDAVSAFRVNVIAKHAAPRSPSTP
jgi:N-acetylmuramoyl-L-alanine amidase